MTQDFVFHKSKLITPLSELPKVVEQLLQAVVLEEKSLPPNPISVVPTKSFQAEEKAGHYFMGGLFSLMQAVRLLQSDPSAIVTYVNDGQLKKSTQSAHQGHVHPTEWTTPELGTWQLFKILLNSFHLLPAAGPDDVVNYSYVHFPLSKIRPTLFARNFGYRVIHTLLSKNGATEDDRWQCEAVRKSLSFHAALSDEIEREGGEPYFASGWRLIWSQDLEGIERKKRLWNNLGIQTETLSQEELRGTTLLKENIPLYGLKVLGDGKFFANADRKIVDYLSKKYPNRFQARTATVSHVYIDGVLEVLPDGTHHTVSIDSFLGSVGHNQVYKDGVPLWNEVPVTGVSTLWVSSVAKEVLLARLGSCDDEELCRRIKQFVGCANLTNLHMTIWDACVEGDMVYIIVRATEGANFNSPLANPKDLVNMQANINRFFIGSWRLITAGSCVRKTTTSNVPELKERFVHGLSGIGFSFSGAPLEMLKREPLTANFWAKIVKAFWK